MFKKRSQISFSVSTLLERILTKFGFTFCRDVLPIREARVVQARTRPELELVAEADRLCEVASRLSSHTETKMMSHLDEQNWQNASSKYSNHPNTGPKNLPFSNRVPLIVWISHDPLFKCPVSRHWMVWKPDKFVRFLNGGSNTGHICLVFGCLMSSDAL